MELMDIKEKLKAKHADELQDNSGYSAIADELDKAGKPEFAGILRDIANEEETHAELLGHIVGSL